jgi:hypothetical protein
MPIVEALSAGWGQFRALTPWANHDGEPLVLNLPLQAAQGLVSN